MIKLCFCFLHALYYHDFYWIYALLVLAWYFWICSIIDKGLVNTIFLAFPLMIPCFYYHMFGYVQWYFFNGVYEYGYK